MDSAEVPQRVVLAPDSFKGSAAATEVARAIARGWAAVRPQDLLRLMPMADGGEGTLDAFELAVPGSVRVPVRVTGPDDRPVDSSWLALPDGTGVVELASTSGITLLDPLRPLDAHTEGFGEAIAHALDTGVRRLLLAIGGSSSTDGGVGALSALGARFLDADEHPIASGGRGLASLRRVDTSRLRALPRGGVRILSDVISPLLGPSGAAAVFGPQKGADPDTVAELEAGLAVLARQLRADPVAPGTGAAGGTGFGLLAWGAAMAPGAAAVGEALGLPEVLAEADVAITGEGRFDAQSSEGKVPSYVAELGAAAGGRAMLVAGSIAAPTDGFAAAVSLVQAAGGLDAALANPLRWLEEAGRALALSHRP
ncbi:glycerate kinase [Planctomonas psychrotolerans]|uniref:glycerate kinase n=1 Tax=Planctomonas psychrotolerans TaxID=2528712 RepID=UPI001D0D58DA|nr:glycerate kinase [Planctomonas psychrotolerans]